LGLRRVMHNAFRHLQGCRLEVLCVSSDSDDSDKPISVKLKKGDDCSHGLFSMYTSELDKVLSFCEYIMERTELNQLKLLLPRLRIAEPMFEGDWFIIFLFLVIFCKSPVVDTG